MIVDMSLVRVVALSSVKEELVERVQELGLLHLEMSRAASSGERAQDLRKLYALVMKLRGVLDFLGVRERPLDASALDEMRRKLPRELESVASEIEHSLDVLFEQVRDLSMRLEEMSRLHEVAHRYLRLANHALPFVRSAQRDGKGCLVRWVEAERMEGVLFALASLHSRGVRHVVFEHGREREWRVLGLSFPPALLEEISELLKGFPVYEFSLPPELWRGDLLASLEEVVRICSDYPEEIASLRAKVKGVSERWSDRLLSLLYLLEDRIAQLEALNAFSRDDQVFDMVGWIPTRDFESFSRDLKERFGDRVLIYRRDVSAEEWDLVPVKIENRPLFSPFEIFLKLVSLPRYGSVDPTPLVGVFFPLFFGMMVGDVGYGLLMLLLSLWGQRRWGDRPLVRQAMQVLRVCSLQAILWGFVFGELFGELGHELLHMRPLWVNRLEAIAPTMVFSVALGVFHLVLGLAIGAINRFRAGDEGHGWANLALIGVLAGLFGLLMELVGLVPGLFRHASVALLSVSIPLLLVKGGIWGLIEAFGVLGNALSYVRLMAIGLCSVILAVLATTMGAYTGSFLAGLVVAVLFHLLNFVLAMVDSSLQGARLHYVEFFSKFYERGRKLFRPFRRRGYADA